MIDIQILRLCRTRADYNRVSSAVNPSTLEQKTRVLFKAIGRYYAQFSAHSQLNFTDFVPFFERTTLHKLSEDDKEVYKAIIKNMSKNYPDDSTRQAIIRSIQDLNLAHTAMQVVERYNEGLEVVVSDELKDAINAYDLAIGQSDLPEVDSNVDEMLLNYEEEGGLKWRLNCLNKYMRPLQFGDFGLLAARPDQGKTSFIASELTYLASQLAPDECAVWFNNEGLGKKIIPRCMQAALNVTTNTLIEYAKDKTLYSRYNKVMNGPKRIRVMDIHGYSNGQVEQILNTVRPKIVVYDMIDNIQGFRSEARTDLALEKMYQWAREMCVKYECVGLATSQISAEGAGEMYPHMSLLKDSRTGKQGACDFQIMIGSKEGEAEYDSMRWLSIPKNKLRPIGAGTMQEQVNFNRDTARYEDIA